jgi:prepilin-type N-terminal cleavage/methylation domain-containing protein
MRRSRGFTLVELLVVIAIIALLISILAPSLKTAKDLTRQAICAVNLRSIATANQVYGAGNNGTLPKVSNIYHPPALAEPYDWNNTTNQPILLPDGSGRNRPYGGLGNLHFTGLIQPDSLYCPLMNADGDPLKLMWQRKGYPDPWSLVRLPEVGTLTMNFYAGYMWNVNITAPAGGGGRGETNYNKMEHVPSGAIMAMDIYFRDFEIAHWLTGPTTPSWQVAFPDGSVQLKQCQEGYRHMQQTDMYGEYPPFTDFIKGIEYIQGKL